MIQKSILVASAFVIAAIVSPAQAADAVLAPYAAAAPGGFSAAAGEKLYRGKYTGAQEESCTSCHTSDAKKAGQHAKTGKVIDPLAPVAAPKRFTDPAKVEKWFRRNCKEVLGRECTAQEKGDFVTYMRSVK